MKVLIAPDSFKGTFSATEVIAEISIGVRDAGATPIPLPVADGGEGTYEALCAALGAELIKVPAANPWGQPLTASFGLTADGLAIVELAQASGLHVPHAGHRDPVTANTYGTGQVIAAAAQRGAKNILVAAGGSATTDGGAGAVQAITDSGGLGATRITVLSDVTTTFIDAARVFGPQKGADAHTVELLTHRLEQQASQYPKDPSTHPRTGAAGGFAGGLWAHFDAELVSGADHILDVIGFEEKLREADIVVVGEGRLDSQTSQGKIIEAILRRVRQHNQEMPVIAVVGSVAADLGDYAANFSQVIIASDPPALREAGTLLAAAGRRTATVRS
ncbi:glycerate kinase [Corynebacterium sp. YIM 101645]|uniref:Glycerate kinase n=1 Tax=Corynebacterium lemuris TaxID=1859292 RepID=A0ABT2FW62_9CORY|nr:glycerate kinase [Corynebacterium lemuris]MCS5479030.1 glycerate kinase [Corynebacterium lemuris]